MIRTMLIALVFTVLILAVAMLIMWLSKGVRVKGAHARGEHKRLDKAKARLRKK